MRRIAIQRFFRLEPYSVRYAFSTLFILISAYFASSYYSASESHWLLLAAILLSQVGLKAEQDWQYIWQVLYYLAYGFLAASVIFVITCIQPYPTAMLFAIVFIAFITAYLGRLHYHLFFLALIISLLSIKAAFIETTSLDQANQRASLILLASAIVFLVRFPVFAYQRSHRSHDAQIIFLQKLKKLFQCILADDLQAKEYEKGFQAAWSNCLAALRIMKQYLPLEQIVCWERIWDITLSLGSLRYRITDFSAISMARQELQAILKELFTILSPGKIFEIVDLEPFNKAIQSLESLYQGMLQTVTKDPLILLLFIQDLYALKEELANLKGPITASLSQKQSIFRLKRAGLFFASRSAIAVFISLMASYFLPQHTFWLPLSAILMTQIELGLPLHQMLQRAIAMMITLAITMQVFTFISFPYSAMIMISAITCLAYWYAYTSRRYLSLHLPSLILIVFAFVGWPADHDLMVFLKDMAIGSAIGITSTLLIFGDKPDIEFPLRVVPLLMAAKNYFAHLIDFLLNPQQREVSSSRELIEALWSNRDLNFPIWVFEPGFNPMLRAGHHYFVVHLGQVTEILFALHHLARHRFEAALIDNLRSPLTKYVENTLELFANIAQLLEGKELTESRTNFIEDMTSLEESFKAQVDISLELLGISKDYVYLAALMRYLKDLRGQLLQLAFTLR